jgi:hypothetical protein
MRKLKNPSHASISRDLRVVHRPEAMDSIITEEEGKSRRERKNLPLTNSTGKPLGSHFSGN